MFYFIVGSWLYSRSSWLHTISLSYLLTSSLTSSRSITCPQVARTLEGVLEQLGNTASSAKEALSVPQMACMGIHTFGDYAQPMELSHVFNEPLRGRHVLWDEV